MSGEVDFAPEDSVPLVEERIQLVEETLRVDKTVMTTGIVRVRTVVEEQPAVLHDTLVRERIETEHVAIDRVVDVAPVVREVDGVTIIPVVEERLRLVRELVLVEEIHMRRVRSEEPFEQTATRRVMRVVVERDPVASPTELS